MTKQELEWCISEYGRDIYSFCKYLTGNGPEADDLYQDTFLTAVEVLQKIVYQRYKRCCYASAKGRKSNRIGWV